MISARKGAYQAVEAVEAPDPQTVRFRLKWPEASFLVNLASPFSWIYKADILARDARWYETNVMGTGPFKFVEHVKGSHWVGEEEPGLLGQGQAVSGRVPGALHLVVRRRRWRPSAASAPTPSSAASSPVDRDSLVQALGSKITVQESPWDCVVAGGASTTSGSPSTTSASAAR